MSEQEDLDILVRAAARAADRPFYFASALRQFQSLRRLDEAGLAELLGCSDDTLRQLALCRRPAADTATFRTDVEAIAQRFGLRGLQLAQILREADSHEALQTARDSSSSGMLMAARDRRTLKPKKARRREE